MLDLSLINKKKINVKRTLYLYNLIKLLVASTMNFWMIVIQTKKIILFNTIVSQLVYKKLEVANELTSIGRN